MEAHPSAFNAFLELAGTPKNGNAFGMASEENLPLSPDVPHNSPALSPRTLAFLILRLWLGAVAIASGLAKFAQSQKVFTEDLESGEMTSAILRTYSPEHYVGAPVREFEQLLGDPLLPTWVLQAFYYALGPALILFGSTLLLGLGTRISLFALGLIFVALTFGLALIDPSGSAGTLGIYILAIAAALALADHNRFCLLRKF